jgi:hypothetical protein
MITRLYAFFALLILGAGGILCSGCQQEQTTVQKQYYPDGKLRVWQQLRNNQLHGQSRLYYPSGHLQHTYLYVQGKLTGEARFYYESGTLQARCMMLEDSLHGHSWAFYRNGHPREHSVYRWNQHTGIKFLFDSLTGKKVEHHVYVREYDKAGEPTNGMLLPITEADNTIEWGEKYTGFVRFGYPLNSSATMVVGRLGKEMKALDRYPVIDTFQVVQQSSDGRFHFSFFPRHPGKNTFSFKFLQPGSPWDALPKKDSLSVDGLSTSHAFLVQETLR